MRLPAFLRRDPERVEWTGGPAPAASADDLMRRWDPRWTSEGNWDRHRRAAFDTPINQDLSAYLENLRARCEAELARNPMLEGVVGTYVNDLVGKYGPTMKVVAEGAADWARDFERLWNAWWRKPDSRGRLSGPELLRLWVWQLAKTGDVFVQMVNAQGPSRRDGMPTLRLHTINARQVGTPAGMATNDRMALGVEFSEWGEPVAYWVRTETPSGLLQTSVTDTRILAGQMIHYFVARDPDQARGFPWVSSGLEIIEDLRQYDRAVLKSAHQAACQTAVTYTVHPDLEPQIVTGTKTIAPGTITALPPGWQLQYLPSSQPTANYVDFRRERHRELGRPFGMPLMLIRLDSSEHNYASARFDAQVYDKALESVQGGLEWGVLDVIARAFLAEAVAMQLIAPAPRDYEITWLWPQRPHVDPAKEAVGEILELNAGLNTMSAIMARRGRDFDEVVDGLKRERAALVENGLEVFLPRPTGGGVTGAVQGAAEGGSPNRQSGGGGE